MFKDLGLTQDQAQKLVSWYADQQIKSAEAPTKAIAEMRANWLAAAKADPVLGPKWESVGADISKYLNTLGSPEEVSALREAFNVTGAGDHPAIIKAFYRAAQAHIEGKPVSGSGPSPAGQSAPGAAARPTGAQAMYPHLPS